MKVICIDTSPNPNPKKNNEWFKYLKEGSTYEVEKEVYGCYKIFGIDHPYQTDRPTFMKRRFVPVSDIDEKEFERNYNKELA